MDAVDVPVVERREGLLRAVRDGTYERSLVGVTRTTLRHPLRAPAPAWFPAPRAPLGVIGRGRPSKPVLNTTSVSVEKTSGVVWILRTISPRCSMSRARILSK